VCICTCMFHYHQKVACGVLVGDLSNGNDLMIVFDVD